MPRGATAVAGLVALAVAFVVIGILYQTGNLQLGANGGGKHVKHAIVAYGVALLCLIGASFARPRPA